MDIFHNIQTYCLISRKQNIKTCLFHQRGPGTLVAINKVLVGCFILHSSFEGHSSYLNINMSQSICELLEGVGLLLVLGFLNIVFLPLNRSHFMEVLCNLLKNFPHFSFELATLMLLNIHIIFNSPQPASQCFKAMLWEASLTLIGGVHVIGLFVEGSISLEALAALNFFPRTNEFRDKLAHVQR